MSPDFFLHLLLAVAGIIGSAFAAYAAMKGDLVRAMLTAEAAAQDAREAHQRIDAMLNPHH